MSLTYTSRLLSETLFGECSGAVLVRKCSHSYNDKQNSFAVPLKSVEAGREV
jgi:hypothetical protein